ncbi:protein YgfX [Gilvimarinus sp. F26214L]|uniref:protein YgfX n=1 Tax=Gilvimarinus sp. DZF01 TaxID=3461371 RepID=UPI0040467E4E
MTGLSLHLRPSRLLLFFLGLTHLAAAGAVWLSALPYWACLVVDAGILLGLPLSVRPHLWPGSRQLSYQGEWRWISDVEAERLELRGEFLVTPWLIVLQFVSAEGRRRPLILLPDSADADDLRRLRVLLRYGLRNMDPANPQ